MKRFQTATAVVASVFALCATTFSASAVTIVDTPDSTVTSAFAPGAPSLSTPVVQYASGTGCNGGGCFRDPFEGTAFAGSTYLAIEGTGSATYIYGANANFLSLLWGSVD